jgi:hypothetical protein
MFDDLQEKDIKSQRLAHIITTALKQSSVIAQFSVRLEPSGWRAAPDVVFCTPELLRKTSAIVQSLRETSLCLHFARR